MKSKTKSILIETISLLLVVLFVYAAASKLMDFSNFQRQLGESPIIRGYANIVAWGIPTLEIIIAFLLVIPKFRLLGLYTSLLLLVMFTAYLFIILNFSDDIPCSCGGILNKMGWKAHIYFNLVFIAITAIGIKINSYKTKHSIIYPAG